VDWDPFSNVVVVSPHVDDGVFSLGATISRASRSGGRVEVLTVFGCDPTSREPANGWDRRAGFATEGDAARARRVEDEEACRLVGAVPRWLEFRGGGYTPHKDTGAIWAALAESVGDADAVLAPGFPLTNADHVWLAKLITERRAECRRVGLYAEQPYRYTARRTKPALEVTALVPPLPDGTATWENLPSAIGDRRRKRKAILAYRSQLPLLGFEGRRNWKLNQLLFHEALHGGEAIAWLPR
jgi:LmbE family N-acetylglucosaminyl deacetylase